ncbi:hypothetical protein BN137_4120 [Cronobacter condimenti 1330]|uniref:Uncharacterized protein n=1 Tax=Cronobacter condimenti 1330 TaxID=1073999 RepID=K8A4N7_9ENTR|nr:hypothetical protein BN137_4120 [Cronobacter condimenti 1330]
MLVAIGFLGEEGFNNTTRGKDFNPQYVPISLQNKNKWPYIAS